MQGLRLPKRNYSKEVYPAVKACLGAEAGKERTCQNH